MSAMCALLASCGSSSTDASADMSAPVDASMKADIDELADLDTPDMVMMDMVSKPDSGDDMMITQSELLHKSPEDCGSCHEVHLEDWSGSMHAYATKDPIFVAMLQKGIKETEGKLDQFCIQCHAPVASKLGDTPVVEDSGVHQMPLDRTIPIVEHGVVCTTCHATTSVEATLNAEFTLEQGAVLYGPSGSDAANEAHVSAGFGEVKSSSLLTQSLVCGSCHNVVNPKGALLENTFSEWYAGPFNTGDPSSDKNCQDCHMPLVEDEVVKGSTRMMRRHTFVGVDLALIDDFPQKDRQLKLVEELLQQAADLKLQRVNTVNTGIALRVDVKNINNGHALPSGSTADRQVWVHVEVFDQHGELVFESGMMDENGDLMDRVDGHSVTPDGDPDLLMYGSLLFDEEGHHVNFPWQASRSQDFLLQPGQTGWREFRIEPEHLDGVTSVMVRATLNYRTFPPFLIQQLKDEGFLGQDEVPTRVPVVEMATRTISFSL